MQNVLSIRTKIFIICLLTCGIISCGGGGNSAACSAILGVVASGSSACNNTDNANTTGATTTPPNVNINTAPIADAGPNQSLIAGSLVVLDGTKSVDANNNALNFKWVLTSKPSGSAAAFYSSTMAKPFFTADLPGLYVASLIVNNGKLDSIPAEVKVVTTLGNAAPVANAGTDQTVLIGSVVKLDGTKSTDANNDPLTVYWAFVDKPKGSNAILSSPTNAQPSFTPDVVGSYVLSLVVNDGKINSDPSTTKITVFPTNQPPVAVPGVAQIVPSFSNVTLDGINSKTYSNNPLSFSWSLISKPRFSSASLVGPNTPNPSFLADLIGQYLVSLVVSSGGISSSPATIVISAIIKNDPPVAIAAIAGNAQTIDIGKTVTLDGSQSFDPNMDPLTYSWVLVKPSSSQVNLSTKSSSANATFTADLPGDYVATLTVNDGISDSVLTNQSVTRVTASKSATYQLSSQDGRKVVGPPKDNCPLDTPSNSLEITLKTTNLRESALVPYTLSGPKVAGAEVKDYSISASSFQLDASGNAKIMITNNLHTFDSTLIITVDTQALELTLSQACKIK